MSRVVYGVKAINRTTGKGLMGVSELNKTVDWLNKMEHVVRMNGVESELRGL